MDLTVEYRNWLSRLLLKPAFEWQFILPLEPPPALLERFLQFYERMILRVDTSHIQIDRPIFLLGVPRSGTTMLQDILCAHPHVAYITNAMQQFPTCFCAAEDLRKRLRLDFRGERFLRDGIEVETGTANEGHGFLIRWLQIDPYSLDYIDLRFEDLTSQTVQRLYESVRKVIWCFGGEAHRFFNKNPILLFYAPLLKDLFPNARIIHIVRDARSCANSLLKLYQRTQEQLKRIPGVDQTHPFIPYPRFPQLRAYLDRYGPDDIRTTAHIWNSAISFITEHKTELPFFYEVRYEDILANPQQEIRDLCEFCEFPFIDDPGTKFGQKVRQIGVVAHTNRYGDFATIESICGENMKRYGYL